MPENVEATLELGNGVEIGRVLWYTLEKAEIAMKVVLKAILVRAQKGKRRAREKVLYLRDYIIIMNRMLVEIWVVEAILMRF